jgi:hypothetical protein
MRITIILGILKGISCISSHGVKLVKSFASPSTTSTTTDLDNLKNATISFLTAIGVGIILALTKKLYDAIKKKCASKAMEENIFLENVQNIITQHTTTNILFNIHQYFIQHTTTNNYSSL